MVSQDKHDRHDICPGCEMPLKIEKKRECPYCGTVLVDTVLDMNEEEQSDLIEDLGHEDPGQTD